jgi:hypothetical protein
MTRQARDLIATGDSERAADLLERAIAIDDGAGFGYLYLGYVTSPPAIPIKPTSFSTGPSRYCLPIPLFA